MVNAGPQDRLLFGAANTDGTFTGITTDEATHDPIEMGQHLSPMFVIIGNGTTSGGNITLEEAFWFTRKEGNAEAQMPYSGTWSSIVVVPASDVTGGKQKIVHIDPNAFKFVRVRISDAITGGGGITACFRAQ